MLTNGTRIDLICKGETYEAVIEERYLSEHPNRKTALFVNFLDDGTPDWMPRMPIPLQRAQEMGEIRPHLYPQFDELYIAVFNCLEEDKEKGYAAVLARFGEKLQLEVRKSVKAGIMNIFNEKCTPVLRVFAETVGRSVEDRHSLKK